jgi:hypothetical protein
MKLKPSRDGFKLAARRFMTNLTDSSENRKTRSRDPLALPTTKTDDESASLAGYIADMSAELAQLARRGNLPMLAYFLNLAHVEAQIYVRENGHTEIRRSVKR